MVAQFLAEITVLAEQGGTSRQAFLEFLNNSVMGSVFTRYKSPALVNLDFSPTFTNVLLRKDFDLGLEAAREHGVPMPVAALAAEMVSSAIGAGHTSEDFATLLLEQARRSGVELVSERRTSTTVWGPTRMGEPRPLSAPGHMGVDYEERVDFARLRDYRLGRAKAALESSECGAFLLFDFYNIRYTTQTWIGGALGDKMTRYALLTRTADPLGCGISARPCATTRSTRTGCPTRTAAPACSGCAVLLHRRPASWCRPSAKSKGSLRTPAWPTPRSASTSSSPRSCSRCSAKG